MKNIIAPDGYYITQAGPVPAKERIFASAVYLGRNDAPENWKLVTAEEAEEMKQAAAAEAEESDAGEGADDGTE